MSSSVVSMKAHGLAHGTTAVHETVCCVTLLQCLTSRVARIRYVLHLPLER
jgi:hypothetical protein